MMLTTLLSVLLLAASTTAAPTTTAEDDDKVYVKDDFYPSNLAIYTAEHEIVSILAPINDINFGEDSNEESKDHPIIFFALADFNEKGERTDQGLFVLDNGAVKKLLDNGRDSTADGGDNKIVYFGAKDGLYDYDHLKNTANKFGTVTDSIVQLSKLNNTHDLYILTEDKHIYKVTNEGTNKVEVSESNGADQIAVDFADNLYYSKDSKLYIYKNETTKEVALPSEGKLKLIRPPFVMDNGIFCLINDDLYSVNENGTTETTDFIIKSKPSAYAIDSGLLHYYGFNKKIYEYNLVSLLVEGFFQALEEIIEQNKDKIEAIAVRSKNELGDLI